MLVKVNTDVRTKYLRVNTIQEAKQLFGDISSKERVWRQSVSFDRILNSPRQRLGIGEHDRVESYVFGNGVYPIEDIESHRRHFPISIKVVESDEVYLAPGQVIDFSAKPSEFPWETGNTELYLYLKIKNLIISRQCKIVVSGNVFVFECDHLIGDSLGADKAYINLRHGYYEESNNENQNTSIKDGKNGKRGSHGKSLKGESTSFGMFVTEGTDCNMGTKGANGEVGYKGKNGKNGSMLYLADLRFKKLTGVSKDSIVIQARAEDGSPGGYGGNGGDGGKGGNGADGSITPFGIVQGLKGGDGGNGGNGGDGGKGGNGGLSSDIFVSIPYSTSQIFKIESKPSLGGAGGIGGKGGKPGKTGENGQYFPIDSNSQISSEGKTGLQGTIGKTGKNRPSPKVHIYESPSTIIESTTKE